MSGFNNSTNVNGTFAHASLNVFDILNVVFTFIIMIGVGASLDIEEAKKIVKQKKALVAGTLNQYVVMPALLWGFSQVGNAIPLHFRAAMIILGTCPGGVLSNILCMWLHADPNLSITMTSWTVLLSLGALPLNIYLYLYLAGLGTPPPNQPAEYNFAFQVDWAGLCIACASVLGGNVVGIIAQRFITTTKRNRKKLEFYCLLFAVPQGLVAFVTNSSSGAPSWSMAGIVYVCLLAPPVIAFIWATSSSHYLLKLPKSSATAVGIEGSVQNVNIAFGILALSIPQQHLRAEAMGIPIAYATLSMIQCAVFGLIMWKLGWTDLDPHGKNPCSVWCGEYYRHALRQNKGGEANKENGNGPDTTASSLSSAGKGDANSKVEQASNDQIQTAV